MNLSSLKNILEELHQQKMDPQEAFHRLQHWPYEDIGFAHIDHHRSLRKGFPEVIYGQGKTTDQIFRIAKHMLSCGSSILVTRVPSEVYEALKDLDSRAQYYSLARIVAIDTQEEKKITQGKVLILSAGTADIPVAEEALITARTLGSTAQSLYDVGVAGIHRLLDQQKTLLEARVIVVVAGMEGALASVVGGLVDRPVIAVPTSVGYGASFQGLAALLTMLNSCATGIATVNIDNGFGAGYLAHKINILGEFTEE